jgi:ABC-2 type transport system permease protein
LTALKLFIALLKIMFRDWLTLFWGLAFPVMFIVIFGLFNLGGGSGSTRLAIIDQAQNEQSSQLLTGLRQVRFFKLNDKITDETEAKNAIKEGNLDAAIIIPQSFRTLGTTDSAAPPIQLTVYYNQQNVVEYELVRLGLNQFIDEINLNVTHAPKLFTLREESVESNQIKYMDYLLPGIMGMGLMLNAIIGIAVDMTRYREQRILRRIRATPLPPRVFVIGQVLAYLVLVFIQATLIILVATTFFGATVHGSLVNLYLLTLLGTLIFLNVGFIVAGVSRTPSAAGGLSQVIGMPMMFLSGSFFPTTGLPGFMQAIVQFLPLTPLLKAMRAIALNNAPLTSLGPELLYIGLWVIVTFAVAAKVFTFRTD